MRNWHFLIPIIAVAVWILSSLFRGAGEQKVRRTRAQAEPDEPPNPDRPKRNANDIDRFLQEVSRRRQEPGDRRNEPERRPQTLTADIPLAILVEPPPRTTKERPSRRRSVTLDAFSPAEQLGQIPAAQIFPWTDGSAAPPPPLRAARGAQGPVTAKQLIAFLQTPGSLGAAIALSEILDKPLSKRRRR